jgi:filamentous hemagglutinin family protein
MHPRLSKLLLTTTALLTLGTGAAGGPNGATVVGGSATVSGAGTAAVTVNQASNSAIINWNTFNIGAKESVQFIQPSSSSIALNRVTGGLGPSEILGTLTANGHVFVINRDGILFGAGAVINTAGFLASTSDIKNSDFMAGRYNFSIPGRPDASIVNLGHITATSGGFAALVAPGVRNSGTISATLGTVALASGNSFSLDLYGDRLITLAVNDQIASKVIDVATGQPLKSLVTNDGRIRANGGRVELTAAAARTVVDSVINTSGVIQANSIGHHNGMIVLNAATGGSKPAGAPTQTVRISGTLEAAGKRKGTTGGTILVTGEDIKFVGALVDASGRAGGGKVLIGGDWAGGHPDPSLVSNQSAKLESYLIPTATTVSVDGATVINASARDSGNGGKVILWSNQMTTFAGTILARGGANGGNGGFVETSGHQQLAFSGSVDTRAPKGKAGTLLLDPADFFIVVTCGEFSCGPSQMTAFQVQNLLANQNVVIATNNDPQIDGNGNIFVNAGITWSNNNSLTLSAYRNINIAANVTIANLAGGNLVLHADSTGTGAGTVTFAPGTSPGSVDFSQSTGTVSIFYDPIPSEISPGTKYQNPTNFSSSVLTNPSVSNQLTAYMLVNTAGDLDAVRSNQGGTYALGRDINAGSLENFAPIANFTGLFDGQSHTIDHLTIAPNDSTTQSIGLFGTIAHGAVVSNLNLTNVSVSANPGFISNGASQFVGTLAGSNAGTISNVSASGQINGGSIVGVVAGGLVGQNGMLGQGTQAGLITQSHANVTVTLGDGGACPGSCNFNSAGGLVGSNIAGSTISNSYAQGNIVVGASSWAGGLVGNNGFFSFPASVTGNIQNSYATGNVSSAGVNVGLGGLVGMNAPGATIFASYATGNVTASANVNQTGNDCSNNGSCQNVSAGGLVGQNSGTIAAETTPVLTQACGAGQACATGLVSVGSNGTGGGLVGFNDGIIVNAFATGNVTGAAGVNGLNGNSGNTNLGGLAGTNQGVIFTSFARGDVGSSNVANLQVGGLVGDNSGAIFASTATGNVRAGDGSSAGGLVSNNGSDNSNCGGCNQGDGAAFANTGLIVDSRATGNVSVGAESLAGGFAGSGDGAFLGILSTNTATGAVSGGHDSVLGGFIGALGSKNGLGLIVNASASGAVSSSGANSLVGGFVGVTAGTISSASASGPVTGTSDSFLGGFAGINLGSIQDSTASGSVTGTGSHNVAGGFAGLNLGTIDPSSSSGAVTSGANSIVGGLVGANAMFINFAPDLLPSSSFPVGTISSDSFATGAVSGGPGSTVGVRVGLNNPNSGLPAYPSIVAGCDDPLCVALRLGIFGPLSGPDVQLPPTAQSQILANLNAPNTTAPAAPPGPVADIIPPTPTTAQGGRQGAPGSTNPFLPPGFDRRIVDIPPPTETRLINDRVVVQISASTDPGRLQAIFNQLGLTVLATQNLSGTGSIALQLKITGGQTVAFIIQQLAANQYAAAIQPEYVYQLVQEPAADPAAPASRGAAARQGDAAQYVLQKWKLSDVHRIVSGANVTIAVIDSEIDAAHPDLQGVIAQRFSAIGDPETPHPHGTGMAGAIASNQRLMGIAPSARLLAVHAFSSNAASAQSTTFNILKGIDWATSHGAKVINMSFAGPKDPSLEQALRAAYNKGIVLIAAAGNAGPKSPPLYPGADPNVIAVTATDVDDKIFSGANRGKYVAVSAPGVDILVPAPDGSYQLTTGTSVAAAEVSGIAALLLERDPRLTPADIRRILTTSAKRLGTGDRDDNFGSGLVDPLRAVQATDPGTVATTTPPRRR